MEFYYSSELPKHFSSLFTFAAIRGCGMGELAEFKEEGEWPAHILRHDWLIIYVIVS
jgi:hypothetical protein